MDNDPNFHYLEEIRKKTIKLATYNKFEEEKYPTSYHLISQALL